MVNGSGPKLTAVLEQFGARLLGEVDGHFTVEIVGGSQEIDRFLKRLASVSDSVTIVRSGAMAVARGAAASKRA